jgi:hypothetical protein
MTGAPERPKLTPRKCGRNGATARDEWNAGGDNE